MQEVSLLKTESYDSAALQSAIAQHFKLLQMTIDPAARVVVKPNLIMKCRPARAATTNPAVMEAVIRHLQGLGVTDITIADSPGGFYTSAALAGVYEQTGMQEVANRCGVKLNLDCGSRTMHTGNGRLCHDFDIIDPIADADCVISVCKLKTHCMTTLSCGVKNLFGCVPGLLKPQLHYRFPDVDHFAQMLLDLSELVKPTLTIVDAVDAMEGDGPTGGEPRYVGLTAAARYDGLYALDLTMARLIGLSAGEVPTLAEAVRRGLCPPNCDEIVLLGDGADYPVIRDFVMPSTKKLNFTGNVPRPVAALVTRLEPMLAPKPQIRQKDCIGCGRCAQSCPANTIELHNKKARINLSNCIHCFCCHEMCPVKAIDIKTSPFFRLFSK